MHRVVVTTLRDELITNVNVRREELASFIAGYAVIHDTCIYIDGRPLLPAQRDEFLRAYYASAQVAADVATTAPAARLRSSVMERRGFCSKRKAQKVWSKR